MIKIELDESEARELLDAARDMCRMCLDNMEAIEASFENNDVKIFADERFKTAFYRASKLAEIGYKIENSLNKD